MLFFSDSVRNGPETTPMSTWYGPEEIPGRKTNSPPHPVPIDNDPVPDPGPSLPGGRFKMPFDTCGIGGQRCEPYTNRPVARLPSPPTWRYEEPSKFYRVKEGPHPSPIPPTLTPEVPIPVGNPPKANSKMGERVFRFVELFFKAIGIGVAGYLIIKWLVFFIGSGYVVNEQMSLLTAGVLLALANKWSE